MRLKDVPRIRREVDPHEPDRMYRAVSCRAPFRADHVFEDPGRPSRFGVYWERATRLAATYAERRYREYLSAHGVVPDGEQIGDVEGILYFTTDDPESIPPWFKKSAKRQEAGRKRGFGRRPVG